MKNFLSRLPLFWKVLLPTGLAVACLLVYVVFSTTVLTKNNLRFENIRDVQGPVLDSMTANVAAQDKLVSTLNAAAAAADVDTLHAAEKVADGIRENYSRLKSIDAEDAKELVRLENEFDAYYKVAHGIAQKMVSRSNDLAPDEIDRMSQALAVYQTHLNAFRGEALQRFNTTIADAVEAAGTTKVMGLFFGATGLLVSMLFGYLLARGVLRQVGGEPTYAAEIVERIAGGDLMVDVRTARDDDSSMLFAIKGMAEKLAQVIGEVRNTAQSIAGSSGEISSTAQSISQSTNEQAASVEETSASIEQMSASIQQNTENSKITDGVATQAASQATEGGKAVGKTVSAMKSIAEKIGIVDDIAYQTNLLALNAAIEAARAGEHGKGFAVVASEVRKLAERSQRAAQEIGDLAGSSVDLAEQAGKLLDQIVPAINQTSSLVQEITAASEEQNSGALQINTAMNQLNQVTQQNASASEELAATAEEMSAQAEQLQQLMAYFKAAEQAGAIAKQTVSATSRRKQPALTGRTVRRTPVSGYDESEYVRF